MSLKTPIILCFVILLVACTPQEPAEPQTMTAQERAAELDEVQWARITDRHLEWSWMVDDARTCFERYADTYELYMQDEEKYRQRYANVLVSCRMQVSDAIDYGDLHAKDFSDFDENYFSTMSWLREAYDVMDV